MDYDATVENFKNSLYKVNNSTNTIESRSQEVILLSRNTLYSLKKGVIKNEFETVVEEILFFKSIKQIPLEQLIFYSEVRSFELQYPKADKLLQQKFIKKKLRKLNRFYLYNIDFIQYIEAGHTHFDKHYFTRDHLEFLPITSSKFYFQDPDFSTPRDMLLGKQKGYKLLITYLKRKLNNLNSVNGVEDVYRSNLKWTASKTALTELIYALHYYRAINNGNAEIKQVALVLQNVFNLNLGDVYKIFSEIKSRKIKRTKFLNDLSDGLMTQMENAEE